MEIQGWIGFQNELKENAQDIVTQLKDAAITVGMITGDSLNTAISIGKECGILEAGVAIWEYRMEGTQLNIYSRETEGKIQTIELSSSETSQAEAKKLSEFRMRRTAIHGKSVGVMRGKDFRKLSAWVNEHKEKEESRLLVKRVKRELANKVMLFARMRPEDKGEVISLVKWKYRRNHHSVGFCGDGVNDMKALYEADISISLRKTESSLASSFIASNVHLASVPGIIIASKAFLSTNIDLYRFFALYSFIQAFGLIMLFSQKTEYSVPSYLTMDLFIAINLAMCISSLSPVSKLLKECPEPTILVKPVFFTLIWNALLYGGFMLGTLFFVRNEEYYQTPTQLSSNASGIASRTASYESTVLPS
jgi:cation-transporting ATPase 13A2